MYSSSLVILETVRITSSSFSQGCMGLPMENLWAELGSIKELWDYPWCVGEDFNVFRFPRERNRGERFSIAMKRF